MLKEGEKLEPLGGGIKIIVSDEHKFWTDTVLLANFAEPKKKETACDFGCGCGAIELIWLRNGAAKYIYAIDIQQNACSMLSRSLELNGLSDRVSIINGDIKNLPQLLPTGLDLVVCNPPYTAAGAGLLSDIGSQKIARHQISASTDDIVCAAARQLRFSGRLCMCQRPERLSDIITSMRRYKIEPKKLRFVQQRPSKAPKLFLIEGRLGGRPGGLCVLPTLFIEGSDGGFSDEMIKIYGDYKEGYV